MRKINVAQYRLQKSRHQAELKEELAALRDVCKRCRKAVSVCFCSTIQAFESEPMFAILLHPKESKKRIGTGRLTHLTLKNSFLIEGVTFSEDAQIKSIIANDLYFPVVLYPDAGAIDIGTKDGVRDLRQSIPAGKKLVVFVIDGTWFCAKKMLRVNPWLQRLPKIAFTPVNTSIYQIRKQPKEFYVSTIEAVQFVIDAWAPKTEPGGVQHSALIDSFRFLIKTQLKNVSAPNQKAVRGNRKVTKTP